MTVDCYGLRYVTVSSEEVGARPIGWDSEDVNGFGTNSDGEEVRANKWMTTCPYCANLIEFGTNQVRRVVENKQFVADYICCPNCNAGEENLPDVEPQALDESDPVNVDEMILSSDIAEFVDPLEGDNFGFEIDYERMPGVV